MGNWKLTSLRWSRSRNKKQKEVTVPADKATSSTTGSQDQKLNGTCCREAKRRMRSLISRALQSTRSLFRIGRRAPVSETSSDVNRNNSTIFIVSYDVTEDLACVRQSPYYSSFVNPTGTELNTERTFVNFETTFKQSPVQPTLDTTKLPETTLNSRNSSFSIGRSKILNMVRNGSSTLRDSFSTRGSNKFASSFMERESKLNFSQSSLNTAARSYSKVLCSTFTPVSDASSASPWTAAGSELTFSPISSDQNLSAHTSVNFKFYREHLESEDLLNSESPVVLSTRVFNRTPENRTENENRKTSDEMPRAGGNFMLGASVSHRRNILAEHLNLASKRILRPPQMSRPHVFPSSDGFLTLEALCMSLRQTVEGTNSNSPVSRNEERPPALPLKFRKFRSSCTPIQYPKAVTDDTYLQPQRPTSFPTFARTVKRSNETTFSTDNDYYEIEDFVDVRSPSKRLPRQPNAINSGHPILDVPTTLENLLPPPLPPRCPNVALPPGIPHRGGNTGITSQVECPPPHPIQIPTTRLSETVDVATRSTLRGIATIALASSLEGISRLDHSNSTTVATQTSPARRTVATQTLAVTSSTQTSALSTTDVSPSVSEVTVIHPNDLNESGIYLSMNLD